MGYQGKEDSMSDLKYCGKCDRVKTRSDFSKNKMTKDGLRPQCKTCNKAYYEANKETIAKRHKAYRKANKEAEAKRRKAYYEANKEAEAKRDKAYYEANKETIDKRHKAYRKRKQYRSGGNAAFLQYLAKMEQEEKE
jgi:hypothetical protein